jgi:hypothetical protein
MTTAQEVSGRTLVRSLWQPAMMGAAGRRHEGSSARIERKLKISVNKNRMPLVAPPAVQGRAGLEGHSQLEIAIAAKPPAADEEYTAAQRRAIDAQLDKAAKGPFHGPFDTADEMIADIKVQLKKRATPHPK